MATKKKVKQKVGRKPWKPTEEQLENVKRLAGVFASDRAIYAMLGISAHTFYDYKKANEEFAQLLQNSSENTITAVKSALLVNALDKGNASAQMFILKTKAGWDDSNGAAENPADRHLQIQFID